MAQIDDIPNWDGATARRRGWRVIRKVAPYLWPEGQSWVKQRVVVAMAALVLAKLIAVGTPFFYKAAVDTLTGEGAADPIWMFTLGAAGLTVAYGMARLLNVAFQQLRDLVFAKVGQRALRALAMQTFEHIHALSLHYHITRKTGGLSRIIERGVKGVAFLLRFLLFSIAPLLLELVLIGVVLAWVFDIRYLLVVGATMVLFIGFTFRVTEWRVRIRKVMNDQDEAANQKAIDSLLNFETVKYFSAEAR
ncbi:MAG: ABC transporter transmembrane domain-containing protein, partial [Pseudomonadota bacterium]